MQFRSDEVCSGYYTQLYYYECIGCPLATTPVDSAQEADNQLKDLISRFPPIMRVENGDLIAVHTGNSIKIIKIQAIDKENCLLQTDIGIVYTDAVWKWPWELKQKGDAE